MISAALALRRCRVDDSRPLSGRWSLRFSPTGCTVHPIGFPEKPRLVRLAVWTYSLVVPGGSWGLLLLLHHRGLVWVCCRFPWRFIHPLLCPSEGNVYIIISCDENLWFRAGVHASVSVPCWWGTTDAEIKGPLYWESRAVKCAFFFLSNPGALGLECVCL